MADVPPENPTRKSGHSPVWLVVLVAALVLVGAVMLSTHAGEDRSSGPIYSAAGGAGPSPPGAAQPPPARAAGG